MSLISVITICRDNPAELAETLTSLRWLTPDFQTIVIDGSSGNECETVASKYRISNYRRGRDSGKFEAMNKGIDLATGSGILFMNSGDILCNAEEFCSAVASAPTNTILYSDALLWIGGWLLHRPAPEINVHNLRRGILPSHQATIIPASFYCQHRYDEFMKIAADTVLMRKAFSTLPHIKIAPPFATIVHGGVSSVPGNWRSVVDHYRESVRARELDNGERCKLAIQLFARKFLSVILTRRGLIRLQTLAAIKRTAH